MSQSHSIIIVGVGPFISSSLARKLAGLGWNIALISRSHAKLDRLAKELETQHGKGKVVTFSADAGDASKLTKALEDASSALGPIDVLCYNAARVGPDDLLTLTPDVLEQDFKAAAVGTLVAGQWFAKNANKSRVEHGEHPLLLVSGGVLHRVSIPLHTRIKLTIAATFSSLRLAVSSEVSVAKHRDNVCSYTAPGAPGTSGAAANCAAYCSWKRRWLSNEVGAGRDS